MADVRRQAGTPAGVRIYCCSGSGGVARSSLNHRLQAAMPQAGGGEEAGGFTACSRWLSAATPPEPRVTEMHPEGMPAACA